ncbi:hypothetical protein [Motilibacter deserti]|uniref:Secreted protein n=1 Tax=Motilibacter deserti TaxID=2714956 RepID=A0ABX0GPE4_9ACTN|nr:hypothetical protein [Motilibacter deserti]NHC12323.1 hypothetical protein [Motilibacter deserti]
MSILKKATAFALGAALALPVAVATAAPSSAASPSYAKLRISASTAYPGYYYVSSYGYVAGAPAYSTIKMRLKGDDAAFDDDLRYEVSGYACNGNFSLNALVPRDVLDEDWEGCDEVYATVTSSTGWKTNTANVNMCF